jgi:hypothetical protein
MHPVAGGDHSFKLSGREKGRQTAVYEEIQDAITRWISAITST